MREIVRDKDRLEHMVDAIDCILDYAEGKNKGGVGLRRIEVFRHRKEY